MTKINSTNLPPKIKQVNFVKIHPYSKLSREFLAIVKKKSNLHKYTSDVKLARQNLSIKPSRYVSKPRG